MAHHANKAKARIKDSPGFSSLERPRLSFGLPYSRKSVSYDKLPEEPLKLSVLKLDGSCFDIEVAKTANVAELKLAVVAVFSHLPQKGPGKVSWPHVWGHFCLCYNGQKLVIDSEYVRDFGIKDGDQLHFIRHVSISYNLIKKQSGKRLLASKQENIRDEEEQNKTEHSNENRKVSHYADRGCFVGQGETSLSQLLKEWRSVGKRGLEGFEGRSKTSTGFLGGFKKAVLRCCCKKWHHRSNTLGNISSSKRYLV